MVVHVPMAMLANYASVDGDGLLHVNGGVWEYVERSEFPCTITGYLVAVVELEAAELGITRGVEVAVVGQDGHEVGSFRTMVVVSTRLRTPLVAAFTLVMKQPGLFAVEIRDDAGVLSRVECTARRPVGSGAAVTCT